MSKWKWCPIFSFRNDGKIILWFFQAILKKYWFDASNGIVQLFQRSCNEIYLAVSHLKNSSGSFRYYFSYQINKDNKRINGWWTGYHIGGQYTNFNYFPNFKPERELMVGITIFFIHLKMKSDLSVLKGLNFTSIATYLAIF